MNNYTEARDAAMGAVERMAGPEFKAAATEYVVRHLCEFGPTSAERLTDTCKRACIVPHDDRAFGPVFLGLVRAGRIEKCGSVVRTKGHGTAGGNVWKIVT
jgi:uncharacterized heparinase superfamily protein